MLSSLFEFGPSSQIEIGRSSQLDRSDVVATVRRLEEQSALTRHPDPADRRRNVVELTEYGRERLGQLDVVVAGVQREVFASLSRADLTALVAMLDSIAGDTERLRAPER